MKTMKRIYSAILLITIICALAGCGDSPSQDGAGSLPSPSPAPSLSTPSPSPSPSPSPVSNLSGGPVELLDELVEDITAIVESTGEFMYMCITTEVSAEISQYSAGLSEADFNKYAVSAASSMAAIGAQAHQIVLIRAKDAASAAEVKKLVTLPPSLDGTGGYDPQKWICVWPEQAAAVESGDYVLLIASRKDVVEAGIGAFKDMAGIVGEVDIFFESEIE